jgi:hypothetical protein
MTGKQVKLFLVDGTPGGLTTTEITNWTGSIVSARRPDLAELLAREEAERTSVAPVVLRKIHAAAEKGNR